MPKPTGFVPETAPPMDELVSVAVDEIALEGVDGASLPLQGVSFRRARELGKHQEAGIVNRPTLFRPRASCHAS